ncbi:MAG: aminomethyl-transferring glycine dehydrogenase [Bacteroidia bacterium]|nr:aminomethyl-transferring glycine dehydrogenase [Bacteroidia bacterium]
MSINLSTTDHFVDRHIGPSEADIKEMLEVIGASSLDQLIEQTIPASIRFSRPLDLPGGKSEFNYLADLKKLAGKNKVLKSYIGLGYYGTIVPSAIRRNIFENPGWYTQYTPYQAEISQGRLEALLNFQTLISDMTGLELANASLLDEGTAASEAMIMFHAMKNKRVRNPQDAANLFLVSEECFPQTIDVLRTRALPLGIEIQIGNHETFQFTEKVFGAILQNPGKNGAIRDYTQLIARAHEAECYVVVAADLLSLALVKAPGEMGADAAVGNTQRFGVPMGFGGPHAAYFATHEDFVRNIPGRIIGVSRDSRGKSAFRMTLQTREQHIKREKATSNICTAQALLAIMASMYAVYHGPGGIRNIALRVHALATLLDNRLQSLGYKQLNANYFDTIALTASADETAEVRKLALAAGYNLNFADGNISIALDETTQPADIQNLVQVFAQAKGAAAPDFDPQAVADGLNLDYPADLARTSAYLTHPVFSRYHSETDLMRYIKRLENRDLSLTSSMIPLGSCTMKLNAATELYPVSWPEFSSIHPFAPADQTQGYLDMIHDLENDLSVITGFKATSLQPNSGAQGEYAGLMTIWAYHRDRNEGHRNIVLIPSSAHGTNPASGVMAGMEVVVVKCDEMGNIEVGDLEEKAILHKDKLSCLMVTYPSTHGVFEEGIRRICEIIHQNGGLVYMDGANMNAQVGLTSPANIGADVCHLNLHKTFAIPHGGGGPGMGPICVNEKLAPYLPGHALVKTGGEKAISAVSAAPWGSASILLISYGYIKMLGGTGMTQSTKMAILNANYLKTKLEKYYPVLYSGTNGRVAHEFILDIRGIKNDTGVGAIDLAKRLMDYSFHAPTVSFPVAGTLMIEPTESEPKEELDRFLDAMISIRKEIEDLAAGKYTLEDNPISNAPHTVDVITASNWDHSYSRETAAFPVASLQSAKFWPHVSRIDDTYGDRNLMCVCPPLESYA